MYLLTKNYQPYYDGNADASLLFRLPVRKKQITFWLDCTLINQTLSNHKWLAADMT